MTSPDRWAKVRQVLDEALELPLDARSAHIAARCGADSGLLLEVERLARACAEAATASGFLSEPAAEFAASVFAEVEAMGLADRLKPALAGRYAVERELGRGGMATVFLARDLRHGRAVALKVMKPGLLAADGGERFLREIRISAALTHPLILPLHDSGEADGLLFYVTPFIQGESLRGRLQGERPIGTGEAVRILRDVAGALAYAHRQGIVHRDIKPENILLEEGHAVVADFGIARALGEASESSLGTPAYASPEHAAGIAAIDHRADLYALGVVAYEMLTGANPFVRSTPEAALAAHRTHRAVGLRVLRPDLPVALTGLVDRLLAKRALDRPATADTVLAELEQVGTGSGPSGSRPEPKPQSARRVVLAGLAVLGGASIVGLLVRTTPLAVYEPGYTAQVTREPGLEILPSLSPDGATVAYVAGQPGRMRVFTRSLKGGAAIDIAPDLDCSPLHPTWSPGGSQILFDCLGVIYVRNFPGGSPRALVRSPGVIFTGHSWGPDGTQVVYVEDSHRLVIKHLSTGATREIARGIDIHDPAWSHDGRWIAAVSGNTGFSTGLYQGFGNLGPSALVVVPVSGGEFEKVSDSRFMHMSPVWAPGDRGLFLVSNEGGARDIWFLGLDRHRRPAGPARRLTTGLQAASIALSHNGQRLAYSVYAPTTAIWQVPISEVGPATLSEATRLTSSKENIYGVALSADGAWLAFDSDRSGNADIWKVPAAGGEPLQITKDQEDDFQPDWSPDGRWIAYHSFRNRNRHLFMISSNGGPVRQIMATQRQEFNPRWSPDGNHLAFYNSLETRPNELSIITRVDDSTWSAPRSIADTAWSPNWSPDGRSLAYVTNNSTPTIRVVSALGGRPRVLIDSFAFQGKRILPQPPTWSDNGREVYFGGASADGWSGVFSVRGSGGIPRLRLRLDYEELKGSPVIVRSGRLYLVLGTHESDIYVLDLVRTR